MPVNLIVLHIQEQPYWYFMTAEFLLTQRGLRRWALFIQLKSIR